MNYLTSQTAQKLESIPLMYPIDEAFTVSVKISGDNNWKEVTTSSDIATLGEDRNTITFKGAGTFSLRVSIGERILTEEYVTVESSVEFDGRVCKVTKDVKDITSQMLGDCVGATILIIPGNTPSIRKKCSVWNIGYFRGYCCRRRRKYQARKL